MNNFRPLSLKRVIAKLCNTAIRNRLYDHLLTVVRDNATGFLPGKGTRDAITRVRGLVERACTSGDSLIICFIDFEKAFSSLDRRFIGKTLRYFGVDDYWIDCIYAWFIDETYIVGDSDGVAYVKPDVGVPMGCTLAPLIFVLVLDYLFRYLRYLLRIEYNYIFSNNNNFKTQFIFNFTKF